MTAKQVVTASKHVAYPEPGVGPAGYLTAPYAAGEFKFKATFSFDDAGKLYGVDLKLLEGSPQGLIGALRTKYGEPDRNDSDSIMRAMLWRTRDDVIQVLGVGGDLTVTYHPRNGAVQKGL